jgi:hypothetical protein
MLGTGATVPGIGIGKRLPGTGIGLLMVSACADGFVVNGANTIDMTIKPRNRLVFIICYQ